MPSARTILTQAFKDAGLIGGTETAQTAELEHAFAGLNQWVTDLDTQRATIFTVARHQFALTPGTASYTIGPGATWDVARPLRIDAAGLVLDTTATTPVELPIAVMTDQDYQALRSKSAGGQPRGVYYDFGFTGTGQARIYLFPVPDQANQALALYLPRAMQQFASLDTVYAFPSGYERFVRAAMVVEVADMFNLDISERKRAKAAQALATIQRANHRTRELRLDPAVVGAARYNIYTDQ